MREHARMELTLEPLTREEFAPFGDVIETDGAEWFMINEGNVTRFHDLAAVDVSSDGGRAAISVFRANPVSVPFTLRVMERHPLGSQAFVPVGHIPFLVVVAPVGPSLDPTTLRAFRTNGAQGVNYARDVWHHPLLCPEREGDFLVIDRVGPGDNCVEVSVREQGIQLMMP